MLFHQTTKIKVSILPQKTMDIEEGVI